MVGEKKLKIGNNYFKFQWLKGKVLDVKTLAKTVGGGTIYSDRYAYSSNIEINSVEQLDIFLEDASGAEHAFKLEDFNFSCREGHEITIVKLLTNNNRQGPFIGLYNHTTREHRVKYGLMQIMTSPSKTPSCLLALIAPFAIGLVLLIMLGAIFDGDSLKEALVLLVFGSTVGAWIILLILYQNNKNRKFVKLKNAYNNLDI